MKDALPRSVTVVKYGAVTSSDISIARQPCRYQLQSTQQRPVRRSGIIECRKVFSRANEHVRGRLRVDVFKREDVGIFVNDLGGDLLLADFAKQAIIAHRASPQLSSHRGAPQGARSLLRSSVSSLQTGM